MRFVRSSVERLWWWLSTVDGLVHAGQSPFWTPNVFAGWPQIADPQSLIFSPLHLLLAAFGPAGADGVTHIQYSGGLAAAVSGGNHG